MRTRLVLNKIALGLVATALSIAGCGGATNNNQGTSITLIGTFAESGDASSDTLPAGQTGVTVSIENGTASDGNPENGNEVAGVLTFLGIQNNLTGQFFRTERVILSYYVEGSSLQPPNTTMSLSAVIGPAIVAAGGSGDGAGGAGGATDGSSLPDNVGTQLPNRTFAQTFVVPASIMSYILLNSDALFGSRDAVTMIVTMYVSGVTSAGDRIETNKIDFPVVLKNGPIIEPTDTTSEEEAPAP